MAGSSEGSGGGRRYPNNLEGILRFCTEHTVTEDAPGPSNLTTIDPESNPNPTYGNPPNAAAASAPNDPELARTNQDRALQVLGLHRYRVAGDGNCLFRAVAWQLKLNQEKYHPMLRKAAVKWMRENKNELLEWGLLDGEKEINETEELGAWPGQAAIVALANIFAVNIAVIQGGDKGDIDIQHICPFETAAAEGEKGSVILAYLYNGHYDAIVEQPNLENPEFEAWTIRRKRECAADEALAWRLAAEEGYNGSTSQAMTSPRQDCDADEAFARRLAAEEGHNGCLPQPVSDSIQHVSEVQVSSHTQPLEQTKYYRESPLIVHNDSSQKNSLPRVNAVNKPSRPALSPGNTATKLPEKPPRPPPRKAASVDEGNPCDENRIRITLYPKKQASLDGDLSIKRNLYKPAPVSTLGEGQTVYRPPPMPILGDSHTTYRSDPMATLGDSHTLYRPDPMATLGEGQLRVNRKPAEMNILQQRRLREAKTPEAQPRMRSPSIRVIPIQFVGRQSSGLPAAPSGNNMERRTATRRREYAERVPEYSWSQASSSEAPSEVFRDRDRERGVPAKPPGPTHARQQYSLLEDPARPRKYADPAAPRHGPEAPAARGATVREVPVVVLSARSPEVASSTRARATPAPATYDLNKPFNMPPQLKPYRTPPDNRDMEMMLRRSNYWL